MPNVLVEKLKEYKEIIAFVTVVVAGVFACLNYFAAKTELLHLRCESDLRRQYLEARVESEEVARELYSMQQETARSLEALVERGVSQPRSLPDIRGLGSQEDELRRKWRVAQERKEAAYADIMSNKCQVGGS